MAQICRCAAAPSELRLKEETTAKGTMKERSVSALLIYYIIISRLSAAPQVVTSSTGEKRLRARCVTDILTLAVRLAPCKHPKHTNWH